MAIRIEGVKISNIARGIGIRGGAELDVRDVEFDNVEVPFDIQTTASTRIRGTRISNDPKAASYGSMNKSFLGYTALPGPPLPAMCPSCQGIFPSRNYNIRSPAFYGFDNEECCPFCGYENAKLAQGLFDLAQDAAQIIKAEPLSHAMLATLNAAARRYLAGETTAEETEKAISSVIPALGVVWNIAWQGSIGLSAILAVYFMVMTDHLKNAQEALGQEDSQRVQHQIEELCLEAFGEAAKCRVQIEPIDESGVRKDPTESEDERISHSPKAGGNAKDKSSDIDLPEIGPLPAERPK